MTPLPLPRGSTPLPLPSGSGFWLLYSCWKIVEGRCFGDDWSLTWEMLGDDLRQTMVLFGSGELPGGSDQPPRGKIRLSSGGYVGCSDMV